MKRLLWFILPALSLAAQEIVYVGTYTRASSKGIYAFRYDHKTGALASLGLAAETDNPTFLALHPNGKFLYAVNEVAQGAVTAFSIDTATGTLKQLNRVSTKGNGPCHVSLDRGGKWLFAANYGGGSVAAFPVHGDGTLGEASAFFQHKGSSVDKERQTAPHAHAVTLTPDNLTVDVADLGLDQVLAYPIDAATGLAAPTITKTSPGAGPRHLAWRPDGKFMYVLNEMGNTVSVFAAGQEAAKEVQSISTLPAGFTGKNTTAEIALDAKSKFLYASNRGDNSIAIFRVDAATGKLTSLGRVSTGGKTPRNFALDPAGKFLLAANQDSASVVTFRVDPKAGGLKPTGSVAEVPFPVSIVFVK